jgi:hypothetical protein
MSIFERLKKRQSLAVGDTGLYVQELTFRQINRVAALADADAKTWLSLAYCLVDEHGIRAYKEEPEETPEQLAAKVTPGLLNAIMQAMTKLSKPVDQESLTKN